MAGFIDDGYTREDGFIAADKPKPNEQPRWESLTFTYRPATRLEVVRHDAAVAVQLVDQYSDPEASVRAEMLACEFVEKRLKAWNLKDRSGKPVPITAESLSRVNAGVFGRLYRIVPQTQM